MSWGRGGEGLGGQQRGNVQGQGVYPGHAHQVTRESLKLVHQVLNTWTVQFHLTQAVGDSQCHIPRLGWGEVLGVVHCHTQEPTPYSDQHLRNRLENVT